MVYVTSKFVEYKKINQFRYKNTDESLIFKYELFVIPSKPVKEFVVMAYSNFRPAML